MANKPKMVARIIEQDCIGCTRCLQACPVDAIIGTHKMMHTVLTAECIGCELCLPPCPMDCITLEVAPAAQQPSQLDSLARKQLAEHYRQQHQARKARLEKRKSLFAQTIPESPEAKKAAILAAIERNKMKMQRRD